MAQTNLAFSLGSALATQNLTDSKYVKGGYMVVTSKAIRNLLPVATSGKEGVITKGSLVYVADDDKIYKYVGTGTDNGYEEFQSGNAAVNEIKFTDQTGAVKTYTATNGSVDLENVVTSLGNQNADNITDGVFDVDRIPDLTASKISDFGVEVHKVLDQDAGKVSADAASTPEGVTWKNAAGVTITGTLSVTDADKHLTYFVPKDINEPSYNQYKVLSGQWVMIGTTGELDLSGYQHKLVTLPNVAGEGANNIVLTDKSDGTTQIALSNLLRLNSILDADGKLLRGSKIISFNGVQDENRLTIEAQSGLDAAGAASKNAYIMLETKALADGSKQSYINLNADSVYLGSVDKKILTAKNLTITPTSNVSKADVLNNVYQIFNATSDNQVRLHLNSSAKQTSLSAGYGSVFEARVDNVTHTDSARIYLCGSEPSDGKSVIQLKADKVISTNNIFIDKQDEDHKVLTTSTLNSKFSYDDSTHTLTIG